MEGAVMEQDANFSLADNQRRRARGEELEAEITELCAYRYALEARFMDLLREFDTQQYWEPAGFHSCAHWLNLKCSIGLNAAREKLRVAHALAELPKIAAAFAAGRLSYSKVRAMTRIADSSNEDYLMMIATHGTAYHVETLVQKYRRVRRVQDAQRNKSPHALRSLNWYYDEDDCLVIKARLPAECGAVLIQALEQAMAAAEEEGLATEVPVDAVAPEQGDIPFAEPDSESGLDVTAETRLPKHVRRADALVRIAESSLASAGGSSSADRYRVVLHVTAETSHLENGPYVTAETSRRLCCDAALVGLMEDARGIPLSVGRQTRSIPPWLRRALQARDGGCRFPGCTHTRFVDGHHIRHWADGGETSLDNLVLLCRHHHGLVHEGGYLCKKTAGGEVIFRAPDTRPLAPWAELPGIETGEDPVAWLQRQVDTRLIDSNTCVSRVYAGDYMDWDLAVANLC
jgi:hypothetical protein